jgi:endo-alpha-1,4-polygalactosaminidase (GH114 family)
MDKLKKSLEEFKKQLQKTPKDVLKKYIEEFKSREYDEVFISDYIANHLYIERESMVIKMDEKKTSINFMYKITEESNYNSNDSNLNLAA